MRVLPVLLALGVLAVARPASAQVKLEVNIPVPTITFTAPPPLVVVAPGIQVVEDNNDEVFLVEGNYWVRRDNRWYRSHDHHGAWVVAPPPQVLIALPPGKYKHYKKHDHDGDEHHEGDEHHDNGHGKGKSKH